MTDLVVLVLICSACPSAVAVAALILNYRFIVALKFRIEALEAGAINNRESNIMCLSPYSKLTEPEKRTAWVRGRLDGYDDYFKDKEHIDVFIPGLGA